MLNDHLDNVIHKSKMAHQSGNLRREGLLTPISKSTVNLVIDSISKLIKKCISEEVRKAGSLLLNLIKHKAYR